MGHGTTARDFKAGASRHYVNTGRRTGRGPLPVGQAEHIAGALLEEEKPQRGSYATQAEFMQRARARVTLRYFAFERVAGVRHTYRDNGR